MLAGEAIEEVEAAVMTVEMSLDTDLELINQTALSLRFQSELNCFTPCVLRTTYVASSVRIINEMIVPTAEAEILEAVAQAAQTLVEAPPEVIQQALALEVNISSVTPQVGRMTQRLAMRVAPPPPSSPPSPPSLPPITPPPVDVSLSGMGTNLAQTSLDDESSVAGVVAGGVAILVVIFGFLALSFYYNKKKSQTAKDDVPAEPVDVIDVLNVSTSSDQLGGVVEMETKV